MGPRVLGVSLVCLLVAVIEAVLVYAFIHIAIFALCRSSRLEASDSESPRNTVES
jgi:hypothetical protein